MSNLYCDWLNLAYKYLRRSWMLGVPRWGVRGCHQASYTPLESASVEKVLLVLSRQRYANLDYSVRVITSWLANEKRPESLSWKIELIDWESKR